MLRERHGAKTIRANAVWMLVANGMFAFSRWAIVVIVAKLGSQELVGQYGLAVAMCLPTITICRFGLRILQSTDAHNELSFGEYLSFSLVATPIGLVVVAMLMFAKGSESDFIALVMVVALWNSIESISDLFSGLFQRYERIDYLAKAYILQTSLMVGLMLVGFAVTHSLLVGVSGLVFAAVVRLLVYELPIGGKLVAVNPADGARRIPLADAWTAIAPKLSWRAVRGILFAGTPLAIVTFLMAYTASAPRYVIDDVLKNPARLGVFVALLSLASAQNLVVGGVAQSLASPLAILFVQRERARLVRLILKAMALALFVSLPGLAIAIVFGKPLLSLVFTPAYAADNDVFVILMLAGAVDGLGNVLGTTASSMRRFALQAPIHAIKLAITYGGGIWAVSVFGLQGIAWVLVGAAGFTVVSLCCIVLVGLARVIQIYP